MIFLLLALSLSLPARAVDTEALEQAVPPAARELLGDWDWQSGQGLGTALERLGQWCLERARAALRPAAAGAGTALAAALLCSMAGCLGPEGKAPEYVVWAGVMAVTLGCSGSMTGFLSQARDALCTMVDFSRALLPCIAAASAAAGQAVSGSARFAAASLGMDLLLKLALDLVLPLIYAFVAAAAARAALPQGPLEGPVQLFKWVATTAMTALCTVFTLYLSLSGALAGRSEALAGSVVKTVVSTALPVVGKIVSDAAGSYLAASEMLRGALGIGGLLVVLAVCAGPVLSLGACYLCFKAAAAVAAPFAEGRLSRLIGDIAAAYGMALGLVGGGGAMLFVAVALSTEVLGR